MTTELPDTPVAATYYTSRGWVTVPVPLRSKRPIGDDWQKRTLADVRPEDYTNCNIGIILGEPSGNLLDVDLDCPEAVTVARYLLPHTGAVHGHPGNPGSHGWYITEAAPGVKRYQEPKHEGKPGTTIVELRGTGGQTVVPPSVHESGEPIEWVKWPPEPAQVQLLELQRAVAEVAAAALLARHHPGDGSRHDFALALSGMLSHGGYPRERAEQFVEAVSDAAGDRDYRDRRKCVLDTYTRKNGHNITGAPTLARMVPKDVVDLAREWLGLRVIEEEVWEDPVEIATSYLPVPDFQVELLPAAVRPWIVDIADRMQCPIEFPAASCLVALGTAIGRRCAIRPKRRDDWTVIPNLFGAVISPPGTMKSPPVHEAQRPLENLETEARKEYEKALELYGFAQMVADQKRKVIQEEIRKALKSGADPSLLQDQLRNLPEPPVRRRYILNDTTVEKLGEILNENPNGVLVNRDELAGLLNQMAKEGHECDRSFYLEAWNGDKPFQYDRIGRGTKHIASTCVSVFGTIQPGPLLEHIRASVREGGEADGLVQRFQILVWPDISSEWVNVDRWPDSTARTAAKDLFRKLIDINLQPEEEGEIPFLRFNDEAQEFFDNWREQLERKLRSKTSGNHPMVEAHLSKYRSLFPSLALISHLADWASSDMNKGPGAVSREAALRAAALCEVFEAHARRMYGAALAAGEEAAALLLTKIKSGAIKSGFTTRDVYRSNWAGLKNREALAAALSLLEEFGWVRPETQSTGGRKKVRWSINPLSTGGQG